MKRPASVSAARLLPLTLLLLPSLAVAQRTYIEVGSPNFRPLPIAVAAFQGAPRPSTSRLR